MHHQSEHFSLSVVVSRLSLPPLTHSPTHSLSSSALPHVLSSTSVIPAPINKYGVRSTLQTILCFSPHFPLSFAHHHSSPHCQILTAARHAPECGVQQCGMLSGSRAMSELRAVKDGHTALMNHTPCRVLHIPQDELQSVS